MREIRLIHDQYIQLFQKFENLKKNPVDPVNDYRSNIKLPHFLEFPRGKTWAN